MKRLVSSLSQKALPPLVCFIVFHFLWYISVRLFSLPSYLIPGPGLVWQSLIENALTLGKASLLTGAAALTGFIASVTLGTLIAFLFAQSKWIEASFYPYAIFLQTVPIVGITPIIIIWFGAGFLSVVIVAFIISLFPIITNGTAGLTQLNKEHVELFQVYRASRWQTLVKLRIPNAIAYLVTGAKVSAGLSVIGAIMGEFFAGYGSSHYGLGYLIILTSGQLKTAYLFAAIAVSTILGLLIFGLTSGLGILILRRWPPQ